MSASWNTKWGARRVRNDPPTLAEALVAAQGFTDDRDGQAEIAAGLMGVSVAEARGRLAQGRARPARDRDRGDIGARQGRRANRHHRAQDEPPPSAAAHRGRAARSLR